MNLNQLWAGNDYAYYDMRGRGEVYRTNAQRVRVIRAYQKRYTGNERLSGFAEVQFLHDDGTPIYRDRWDSELHEYVKTEEVKVVEVRARDIAMHWDEYSDEREHRVAEAERIEQERQARIVQEAEAKTRLLDMIVEKYKIPRELVTTIDDYAVRINRSGLEKELGIA